MNKIDAASRLQMACDAIDSVLQEYQHIPKEVSRALEDASTLCWRLSHEIRLGLGADHTQPSSMSADKDFQDSVASEIQELERLLAAAPDENVIERMSLESRLESVRSLCSR